uniref:Odorant receptor n=1 Tax=Mythimna separata TaxID=271217 RepID=A0A7H1DHB2_MYTSE|nr:olfactory receptor 50b [Mythimna separata]
MVWFVSCRCPVTGDVLAGIIVFSLGIASEISSVKFLFILYNIKDVRKIVAECLACDSQVVPGTRFSVNLLRTLREAKKRAMLFWMLIIANGVIYVIKPILLSGRHFMDDVVILYGLEPMFETPNYQISFVLEAASVALICYLAANISAFLIIITGYVQAQLLALSEELIHVWDDAEKHVLQNEQEDIDDNDVEEDIKAINDKTKEVKVNNYIKNQLKDIANRHAVIINLLVQIEGIFGGAIAVEFCVLVIALIAELLGGLQNTYMEVPFALIQVGMDCLIGQKVMDAGAVFKDAVYDCKWERFSNNNMKIALVMLVNAQKPMTVSVGGVTTLSYASFMTIIKSIYSTYTTLRSTMGDKV